MIKYNTNDGHYQLHFHTHQKMGKSHPKTYCNYWNCSQTHPRDGKIANFSFPDMISAQNYAYDSTKLNEMYRTRYMAGVRLYVFAILESQVKIKSADTTENWLFAIDNVNEIRKTFYWSCRRTSSIMELRLDEFIAMPIDGVRNAFDFKWSAHQSVVFLFWELFALRSGDWWRFERIYALFELKNFRNLMCVFYVMRYVFLGRLDF